MAWVSKLLIGFEIHQQLDTPKLFCSCPSILRNDEPQFTFLRKLHLVKSELGEYDIAAEKELLKNKWFEYEGYDTICLVEMDEEPPHQMNREALRIALSIAKTLNMKPVDEIQVMRKIVIDGSNTTGFQRTALIAYDGYIKLGKKKVKINTLCLEEDSARKIRESEDKVVYRLDRLGIPLVEIQTEATPMNVEEAKELALKLGLTLRLFKVKRGLGSIRQDVNISVPGWARVEIKGFQDIENLEKIIKNEVDRQKKLISFSKLKPRVYKEKEVTHIFKETKSRLLKGKKVFACKISKAKGWLGKEFGGKRLAKDIIDYVRTYHWIDGFIHCDELPGYGITKKEIDKLRDFLACEEDDGFIIYAGEDAENVFQLIRERFKYYAKPTPEVRKANQDGTTTFLRPMPTAARMYPETDVKPIPTKEIWEKAEKKKDIDVIIKELQAYSRDIVIKAIRQGIIDLLYVDHDPSYVVRVCFSLPAEMRKEGVEISRETVAKILNYKVAFPKEALPKIAAYIEKNKCSVEEAVEMLNLKPIGEGELDEIIEKVLAENPELVDQKAFKILMGFVMSKVAGRVEGRLVAKKLKEKLGI